MTHLRFVQKLDFYWLHNTIQSVYNLLCNSIIVSNQKFLNASRKSFHLWFPSAFSSHLPFRKNLNFLFSKVPMITTSAYSGNVGVEKLRADCFPRDMIRLKIFFLNLNIIDYQKEAKALWFRLKCQARLRIIFWELTD